MAESIQHKLSRVRPPRVQITYDVEIGDAIEKKELPLVVGIMSDLSGNFKREDDDPKKLPDMKQRKFVEIDRDNVGEIMTSIEPTAELSKVPRRLADTYKVTDEVLNGLKKIVSEDVAAAIDANVDMLKNGDQPYINEYDLLQKFHLATFQAMRVFPAESDIINNYLLETTREENNESLPPIKLIFKGMDDFEPLKVVKQVPLLKKLYDSRTLLQDLLIKLDGNEKLEKLLINLMGIEPFEGDEPGEAKEEGLLAIKDGKGEEMAATDENGEAIKQGEEEVKLLPHIIRAGKMARTPEQEPGAMKVITELAVERLDGILAPQLEGEEGDPEVLLQKMDVKFEAFEKEEDGEVKKLKRTAIVQTLLYRMGQIDAVLNNQLNEIMHHAEFQSLESSWRALYYLVMKAETGPMLKLRLLNASRKDLQNDLEKAVEFDQSALFKMIYEEEYGTFGGQPFSVLVGDFEFGRVPADILFLEKMSEVAAAAHAPFITAAGPKLFDLDSYTDLGVPRDLSKVFESSELIKWNSFRASEDSRYVVLTLPRFLLRMPYDPEKNPAPDGILFKEDLSGAMPAQRHEKYLWGNSAFALTERITNAFSHYKWCAAIRGVEGGGLVEGLPTHTFMTDDGEIALKCPTEIAITDRRENELTQMGFLSLCHCKGTDYAAFFGGQTTNLPKKYNTDQANANALLSSRLPYMLAASRFAHYIKVIMRDKIGTFMTRENVEEFLNRWLVDYVLLNDDAGQELKAQYPLREGRVDVSDNPGKPGSYTAVVYLRPHFQLEELTTSIRLVAELPAPAG